MRLKMKIGAVAMATVIALTAAFVGANQLWAQDVAQEVEGPAETMTTRQTMREEVRQAGLEAAAGVLGMTAEELSDQLWGGKTLADLAEEANVELAAVRVAVEVATRAARQERIREFIASQVVNGRITQERADWILEGIDNGWFGLRRFAGRFDGLGADRGVDVVR